MAARVSLVNDKIEYFEFPEHIRKTFIHRGQPFFISRRETIYTEKTKYVTKLPRFFLPGKFLYDSGGLANNHLLDQQHFFIVSYGKRKGLKFTKKKLEKLPWGKIFVDVRVNYYDNTAYFFSNFSLIDSYLSSRTVHIFYFILKIFLSILKL